MFEKIILRDEHTKTDSRYLSVSLQPDGDLVFEGQDIGDAVRQFFDCTEYEWVWAVKKGMIRAAKVACRGILSHPSGL